MMHYSNLVIIESAEDVEKAVERAMGADEDSGGFWDWYQIGGRWTGAFDGYDPDSDPANSEPCKLCNATGIRKDMKIENGCNGCAGTGIQKKWPTQWAKHPGDVAPIESLTDEAYGRFYRVVTPYSRTFGGEEYRPWLPIEDMFQRKEKPPIDWLKKEYEGHFIVVVDNHS